MNRRELLKQVVQVGTAAGLAPLTVTTVDAAERPVLAVLELDEHLSGDQVKRLLNDLKTIWKGTPFDSCPVVVLARGIHLTFVNARGEVVNRKLED